jgi:small conductance mechanosensitive channel
MEIIQSLYLGVKSFLPVGFAIAATVGILFLARYILEKHYAGISGYQFRLQLMMIFLTFAGILAVILVLPINDTTRGQLLSLIGLLLSAAIALSSTTLIGNAMAGIMLRIIKSFRAGDFIRVGEHFGRVSDRGLFHTEIQNEDRDLTTLPNIYLINNPVKVIRSSGTFISATVSLGYDIPWNKIEKLLLEAAEAAELKDPFVQILQLGDFSITYKVAGLLTQVKQVISSRSKLHSMMLDNLHKAGVEIVSPNFMNTRAIRDDFKFIPQQERVRKPAEQVEKKETPESLLFDKAEEAESLEKLRERLKNLIKEMDEQKEKMTAFRDETEKEQAKLQLENLEERRKRLVEYIKKREEEK